MTRHSYSAPSSVLEAVTCCVTVAPRLLISLLVFVLRWTLFLACVRTVLLGRTWCQYQVTHGPGLPPTTLQVRVRRSPAASTSPVRYPVMTGGSGGSVMQDRDYGLQRKAQRI